MHAPLALRQWTDYQARTPGTWFAEGHGPMSLADAYALQHAVAALRIEAGDAVAGYKVGCTGPGVVQQFGMKGPIRGFLWRSELRSSGDAVPHAEFANLAIEGEIAIRIGAGGEAVSAFPVIELHHFVFREPTKSLGELVANNGLQGGVVLPASEVLPGLLHRSDGRLGVEINGVEVESGAFWPLEGGAAASLSFLLGNLRDHGLVLDPGALILGGTPLGLFPVRPGDHVAVTVDGTTGVECRIV